MKRDLFWKYDDNGKLKYLRLRSYIFACMGNVVVRSIHAVLSILSSGNRITKELLMEYVWGAFCSTWTFVLILYVIIAIMSWNLKAEGDFFTKRIFSYIRGRKLLSIIKNAQSPTYNKKYEYISVFPTCIIVCEETELSGGIMHKYPRGLNAPTVDEYKLWFEFRHPWELFNRSCIFSGMNIAEVLEKINSVEFDRTVKSLLKKCNGLNIIEFSIVYDEQKFKGDNSMDSLLSLKTQTVPLTLDAKGKICIIDN